MKKRKMRYNSEQNSPSTNPLPTAYQRVKTQGNGPSVRYTASSNQQKSPSELAQQLADLCIEIYLSGGERFIPLPPFVLVRVLPKDMVSDGGIILPNQRQNKPVHEGIVLETYRPYEEEVVLKNKWTTQDGVVHIKEYVDKITRTCPVKVGQRVCYPHYEGVPHKYLGEDYVLVRQSADQIKFPYCQVLGIVDYEGDRGIGRKITALMKKYYSVTTSGVAVSRGDEPAAVAK